MKNNLLYIFLFLIANSTIAQKTDSLFVSKKDGLIIQETIVEKDAYNPLAPANAAFYSAVLPGLGQAYNKKYWKIPIIYAGMGVGVYFYIDNNKEYHRFRDAYKRRLAGYTDDEFWGDGSSPIISDKRLINAQKTAQRNKDLSVLTAVVFYLLNIIDANVDAHLKQFDVNENLSVSPNFNIEEKDKSPNFGLSFKYFLK